MSKENQDFEYLLKTNILNPSVSLKQLLEISKKLDDYGDDDIQGLSWVFIIKGKFIFKYSDEAKKTKEKEEAKEVNA